jgi:predicted PurR-regulated permease PerM
MIFWLVTAAVLIGFLYLFSAILLPFFAGMILAYFLDPVADRLQRLGPVAHGRDGANPGVFLVALVIGLMLIIPILASQLADFMGRLPDYHLAPAGIWSPASIPNG